MEIKYNRKPLGVVAALADFLGTATWSDVPPPAREAAHMHFVDTVATTLGGYGEASAAAAVALARTTAARPVATVACYGLATSPDIAAFCNAMMCHSLDWDDLTVSTIHPSAVVLPTALAVGEMVGASGLKTLEAYALGCEVLLRVANALAPPLYLRGFHPTGTIGAIGAAAAAGRLLGLRPPQMCMAFAAAMHQCGGLGQGRGTHQKPLSAANAARAGVVAARLVAEGFTANPDVLESWNGVQDTYLAGLDGEYDLATVTRGLGREWALAAPWPIKVYPAGGARQTALALGIRLAEEHDIDPAQIESVQALVSPVVRKIDYDRPFGALNTRFSNKWCIAVALAARSGGPDAFDDARFKDARIWELIDKVELSFDDTLPVSPTSGFPTALTIRMRDGRVLSGEEREMPGEAGNPLTWKHVQQKFRNGSVHVLNESETRAAWDWLQDVAAKPAVGELMALLREPARLRAAG